MSKQVVVGAGPVGTHTAELLAAEGHEVVVVTRSGRAPQRDGVRQVALDASDPHALGAVTDGATALFNCANPPHYGNWEQVWPALSASLLRVAERSGATLVATSSLYAYGPVDVPMTEALPDVATEKNGRIRAEMWAAARAAHEAGRARVVEVRASDYVGAGLGENSHLYRNVPKALDGKRAWVVGNPDLPHSWTDVLDVARTLVTVAQRSDTWGRVWLAPTNSPRSHREALRDVLAAGGHPMVAISGYPKPVLSAMGLLNADLRELGSMGYIFSRPYVVDSSAARDQLGLEPTPWDEVCRRTLGGRPAGTASPVR